MSNIEKEESPFEKKSCNDCEWLVASVNWWCGSIEAKEARGTGIPGCIHCPYWCPDWSTIDDKYKTPENGYMTRKDKVKARLKAIKNKILLQVEFERAIKYSDAGYFHLPLLYWVNGKDGFAICILGLTTTISWGEAVRKSRADKNKSSKKTTNEFADALAIVTKEIANDSGLRESYKANVAMAFKDEYRRNKPPYDIHLIANNAADNFLNLWCKN